LSSFLLSKTANIKIYKTVNVLVVLYGHKTWTVTVTEEHRLQVFENSVWRRMFRSKRVRVTGGWKKVHNGELHNMYSTPSSIKVKKLKKMRCAGHM
jgi:hypothetical protein